MVPIFTVYTSELCFLLGAPGLILPIANVKFARIRAGLTILRVSMAWSAILADTSRMATLGLVLGAVALHVIEYYLVKEHLDATNKALVNHAVSISCFSLVNFALNIPGLLSPELTWSHVIILGLNLILIPYIVLGWYWIYWWNMAWGCYPATNKYHIKQFDGGVCPSMPGVSRTPITCERGGVVDTENAPGCSPSNPPLDAFGHKHPHWHAALVFEIFVFVLYLFVNGVFRK